MPCPHGVTRFCRLCEETKESPWTVDDPRMWREQGRVGDVAFQHLFCVSKGMTVPDWAIEGLPKMYHLLSKIRDLTNKA